MQVIYKLIKKYFHVERCRVMLSELYQDIDTFDISIRYRKQNNIDDSQFIYGEIMYASFAELLSIVKPQKGEIFHDLGCGGGKAVFSTALIYPELIVRGVEYLQPLYALCLQLQNSLQRMMRADKYFKHQPLNTEFKSGDLHTVDLSQTNIVYLNVTCFDQASWESITTKLETLPVNARVIITTKELISKNFTLIHCQSHMMSWGINTVRIYRKHIWGQT